MSSSKQEEMHRIFESMSQIQVHLSSVNVESCSGNEGSAEWYADDPALMNKVRAGTEDPVKSIGELSLTPFACSAQTTLY
jgi:hypothetical protein